MGRFVTFFLATKFTDIILLKVTEHLLDGRAFDPRPSAVYLDPIK